MKNQYDIIDAYLDGRLSQSDKDQLAKWLKSDAENIRTFIRIAHVHQMLRRALLARTVLKSSMNKPLRSTRNPGTVIRMRLASGTKTGKKATFKAGTSWWALAASFAIVAVGLWFWNQKEKTGIAVDTVPVSIAFLAEKQGNVTVERGGKLYTIDNGTPLYAGDSVRTENGGRAVVSYPDSTKVEIKTASSIILNPAPAEQKFGKKVQIVDGTVSANVAKQPEGFPMLFQTFNARAIVLGTKLEIDVLSGRSKLKVEEGQIRLERLADKASVLVSTGEQAIVVSTDSVPLVATKISGDAGDGITGLAARYPGDVGIERDPSVIFAENFESGDFSRWDDKDGNPSPDNQIVTDPKLVHGGRNAAQFSAKPGKNVLVDLTKWFDRGENQVYARWYCRFAEDYEPGENPIAGGCLAGVREKGMVNISKSKPNGIDYFIAQLIADPMGLHQPGNLLLRSYHLDISKDLNGEFYKVYPSESETHIERGRWYCLELMVKVNTPDLADGEQAFWVNGMLKLKRSGIRWQTSEQLKINYFWLMLYATGQQTNRIWFDDIVVSTRYIGPMKAP